MFRVFRAFFVFDVKSVCHGLIEIVYSLYSFISNSPRFHFVPCMLICICCNFMYPHCVNFISCFASVPRTRSVSVLVCPGMTLGGAREIRPPRALKVALVRIDWDSAERVIYSTDYYQRLTLESWFTNLEQTPLNRCQQLPAPYKQTNNRLN